MGITPPPHGSEIKVSFPEPHVLLLTFNRPERLNAMSDAMENSMKRLLNWFEGEPELWVVIVTGEGRLFCAGADLIKWSDDQQGQKVNEQERIVENVHGFGSVSRRQSNKPIIAAVNGGAYGGGLEMVVNCDLVIAGEDAKFAFPEVKRGVVAIQGAIPRITQIAGHQLAAELLLTGKTISATEARDRFKFVNFVVPPDIVVSEAIKLAKQITANSPDSVQSSKFGLLNAQHGQGHNQAAIDHAWHEVSRAVYTGRNIKEGLLAFGEKRKPVWKSPSKL